jgi:dUTP pyrophosphatase
MNEDEMLMLVNRSSFGFKYNVRMCNQIGIIESDFYNNVENEGHMYIKLQNEGTEDFTIKIGDRICQGIFAKFLVVDEEKEINNVRKGGLGSTGKRDE